MVSAKRELRIGMVGYGFIGKVHTYAYRNIPFFYDPFPAEIKLVGVCASSQASVQKGIEQGGYQFGTTDYRELIAREDIDIIDCCAPNFLHKPVLIEAMRAGKHVYCEKPLAINLEEAREILAVAQKTGVKHEMTFQNRFIPAMMRAKQLVEEGFLGDIFSFRACYLHSGYIDTSRPLTWRMDIKRGGGGAIYDLGSHALDLILFLLGDFEAVYATMETFVGERPLPDQPGVMGKVEVDDLALMLLRLKGRGLGTLEASRVATGTNDELRIEVHGNKGAIAFNLMDPNWLWVYDVRGGAEPIGGRRGFTKLETVQRYPKPAALPGPKFTLGWMRFHVANQHDFLTSIIEDRPASPDFEDGLKVQEAMEAAHISAREERWVQLPL